VGFMLQILPKNLAPYKINLRQTLRHTIWRYAGLLLKRLLLKYIFIPLILFAFVSCNNVGKEENAIPVVADSPVTKTSTGSITDSMAIKPGQLIVPGKSIGLTSIDEKAKDVNERLGRADEGDAAMGKSINTWKSKDGQHSTTIYFTTNMGATDEGPRARQIRITSPYFKTADGLGAGSSLSAVLKYFPAAKQTATYSLPGNGGEVIIYDDIRNGIAFEIAGETCIGIAIHKPGEKAFETYLVFFNNLKSG
jgi:hypothetical protein